MSLPCPDARLRSAAELVRQGAVFADIGTDHAYLPLFLLSEGKIRRAVCADIGEGPLASARAHAADTPYAEKMTFVLTDGLSGLKDEGLTDIAVCGMGGELIADIIGRAPFVRRPDIRLILGPMTRQETLRDALAASGFSVEKNVYSFAEGRYYVTFCVHFDGFCRRLSPAEAVLGEDIDEHLCDENCIGYMTRKYAALLRAEEGRRMGRIDVGREHPMRLAVGEFLTRTGRPPVHDPQRKETPV